MSVWATRIFAIRYLAFGRDSGKRSKVDDATEDELIAAAKNTSNDQVSFLRLESIFGDLLENERFVKAYEKLISNVHR